MKYKLPRSKIVIVLTIAVAASLMMGITSAQSDSDKYEEVRGVDCINKSNNFHVTGIAKIDVYWCSPEGFDEKTTIAAAGIGKNTIYLNKAKKGKITPGILMHELGHNLDFKHKETGIMNYADFFYPETTGSLGEPSKSVGRVFVEYRYINWDEDDFFFLFNEYLKNNISDTEMVWSFKSHYIGNPCDTIYYKTNFSGYGGYKEGELDQRFYRYDCTEEQKEGYVIRPPQK